MAEIAGILSNGDNQVAVIAFFLVLLLGAVVQTLLKMLKSAYDFKALMFDNGHFAERRTKKDARGQKLR